MRIDALQWDDENVQHIAQHGVSPVEVEDVCFGSHLSQKEGDQRYILAGQSAGGRYLNVVIKRIGVGTFRPVTAFDMSESYKRKYRKRFRK
ncbi:MAG: BrnT family toxin [Chloroflexi bacterium]|nr:BrnT family toxin [Chloroflexota bacterium]